MLTAGIIRAFSSLIPCAAQACGQNSRKLVATHVSASILNMIDTSVWPYTGNLWTYINLNKQHSICKPLYYRIINFLIFTGNRKEHQTSYPGQHISGRKGFCPRRNFSNGSWKNERNCWSLSRKKGLFLFSSYFLKFNLLKVIRLSVSRGIYREKINSLHNRK